MRQLVLRTMAGVLLGLVCLIFINVHDVQGICRQRAYAMVNVSDAFNYTAISGRISYGNPTIRDGGFSGEALWIGGQRRDYVEIGWRKVDGGDPFLYWG